MAFKVLAEGFYQGAGDVPGLEEMEEDSWPLLGSPSFPCCIPAGSMAAPSHRGALSGFRQPPSLSVSPTACSDTGTSLTAALNSQKQLFTCLAAAPDFEAIGNSDLHPHDTSTIAVWILLLSIAANLLEHCHTEAWVSCDCPKTTSLKK